MSRKILVGHVYIAHSWSRERYYLWYVLQLLWSKNLCNKIIFEHVLIAHSWPGNGALCGEHWNLFGKSLRQMAAGSTSPRWNAFLLCLHHGKSMIMRKHCQRHNGPEGWVQLTKATWLGHIRSSKKNLDQISSSEYRPSINLKIWTKHLLTLDQDSTS